MVKKGEWAEMNKDVFRAECPPEILETSNLYVAVGAKASMAIAFFL